MDAKPIICSDPGQDDYPENSTVEVIDRSLVDFNVTAQCSTGFIGTLNVNPCNNNDRTIHYIWYM